MKTKNALIALALLTIVSVASVFAWDYCFANEGVTISFNVRTVKLENESDTLQTVRYTVKFKDGTEKSWEQIAVPAKVTKTKEYDKYISDVVPCY